MRILLDLGLQKTGSKARQQFFARRSQETGSPVLLYPSSGSEGCWHRPLHEALVRSDCSVLESVVQEIRSHGDRVDLVVLSYERMWELGTRPIRWLHEALPGLEAVVFLRRHDQLVSSRHNQLHKSHHVTLANLESFEAGMLGYDPAFDYRRLLERWCAVLGREAVVPIIYEKHQSSVDAFFRQTGVEIDLDEDEPPYVNQAVDEFGLSVLREVKRLARDTGELPRLVAAAQGRLARHFRSPLDRTQRYSLTLAERLRIMESYRSSNEWVARQFFPDRDELFPPLEHSQPVRLENAGARTLAESIVAEERRGVLTNQD